MTTEIKLSIGFNEMSKDQDQNFTFTGDPTSKIAIEKGITHFAVFSGEIENDWQFINWKSDTKSGTIFNTASSSSQD